MTAQPTDSVALELQQANIDFVVIAPAADLDGVRRNYVDLFRLCLLYTSRSPFSVKQQGSPRPFAGSKASLNSFSLHTGVR